MKEKIQLCYFWFRIETILWIWDKNVALPPEELHLSSVVVRNGLVLADLSLWPCDIQTSIVNPEEKPSSLQHKTDNRNPPASRASVKPKLLTVFQQSADRNMVNIYLQVRLLNVCSQHLVQSTLFKLFWITELIKWWLFSHTHTQSWSSSWMSSTQWRIS